MARTTPLQEEATQALVAASTQKLPRYELVVYGSGAQERRVPVDLSGITIGTAAGCELRVSDPTVSRMHCEVRLEGQELRVNDLSSTNGVIVNGVPVRDATLPIDSTIHLGQTTIRVENSDQPMTVELSPNNSFGKVLGSSLAMRRLFAVLERIAPTDTTILLRGETGVGKELVARAIHEASPRARKPFVVVDCSAIAENLFESELFGHTRGAFSGAVGERRGLFEEANGGTLFLDEIGELPSSLQPKLLRVLESRLVRRVGSNQSTPIDVRIVAATHVPLSERVNLGTFREDLFYRVAVVEVLLPALRERREDVALLADNFYRKYSKNGEKVPEELVKILQLRAWPGNVRELRNFIERSVSLGWSSPAEPHVEEDLNPELLATVIPTHLPLKDARTLWTSQFEKLYVRALIEKTGWDLGRVAEMAGVHRRSIQRLVAQFGLRSKRQSDEPTAQEDGQY